MAMIEKCANGKATQTATGKLKRCGCEEPCGHTICGCCFDNMCFSGTLTATSSGCGTETFTFSNVPASTHYVGNGYYTLVASGVSGIGEVWIFISGDNCEVKILFGGETQVTTSTTFDQCTKSGVSLSSHADFDAGCGDVTVSTTNLSWGDCNPAP